MIFWGVQNAILVIFVQTRVPKISSKPTEIWGGDEVEVVIFWGAQKAILTVHVQKRIPKTASKPTE